MMHVSTCVPLLLPAASKDFPRFRRHQATLHWAIRSAPPWSLITPIVALGLLPVGWEAAQAAPFMLSTPWGQFVFRLRMQLSTGVHLSVRQTDSRWDHELLSASAPKPLGDLSKAIFYMRADTLFQILLKEAYCP